MHIDHPEFYFDVHQRLSFYVLSRYGSYWASIAPRKIVRIRTDTRNTCGWSKSQTVKFFNTWGCLKDEAEDYSDANMKLPSAPNFVFPTDWSLDSYNLSITSTNDVSVNFEEDKVEWCYEKLLLDPSAPLPIPFWKLTNVIDPAYCVTTGKVRSSDLYVGYFDLVTEASLTNLDPHFHYHVTVG